MKITEVRACSTEGWKPVQEPLDNKKDYYKLASDILARSNVFNMANLDEKGIPQIKAFTIKDTDEIKHVWFVTHTSSTHAKQLSRNSLATIYVHDNTTYEALMLVGHVQKETDEVQRAKCWRDFYENTFPDKLQDPQYLVLRFDGQWGNYSDPALNINFTLSK